MLLKVKSTKINKIISPESVDLIPLNPYLQTTQQSTAVVAIKILIQKSSRIDQKNHFKNILSTL